MGGTATELASLISIAGVWLILFWLYRDYCVDRFRQDMFALRDELFDAAADGGISFNHPAYGLLRNTMNGFIRFAHRFTLLQALMMITIAKESVAQGTEESFPARWQSTTQDLPDGTVKSLAHFRFRMNVLVVKYVLVSSPIVLLTILLPLIGWITVRLCLTQLVSALKSPLDGLDSAAMAEGRA
jgi:hypothetical protein